MTSFVAGWAIGIVSVLLAGGVAQGFAVLFGVSGVLLLLSATLALTNDQEWATFAGRSHLPRGQTSRLWFGALTFICGTGWAFGGMVGFLVLIGLGG